MKRVRIVVSGLVQGVFYRAQTREEAQFLGLSGWVRNLPDGRVEVVAEGPKDDLERLVAWCWKGPPSARVTGVEVEWTEATGGFRGFRITY
jgi:acylphosphatase